MIYWNGLETQQILKKILQEDEVILASGDTVLGLWGRVNRSVYEKLNTIKNRQDKPYLIVIGSIDKLSLFTDQMLSEQLQNLVESCWPGPVTLIFKARPDLPDWIKGSDETVAIRIPDHQGLLQLLKDSNALFSTSANIHSKPIPESVSAVDQTILEQVSAVCTQEGQFVYPQIPSTVLNISTGAIKLVREGAVDIELLKDIIG